MKQLLAISSAQVRVKIKTAVAYTTAAMLCVMLAVITASIANAKKSSPPPALTPTPTPTPTNAVPWSKASTVNGDTSNYTPVVLISSTQIRIYANTNGTTDGRLYVRNCSWSSCGSAGLVLQIASPRDQYIRTSAVVRAASGMYYALLYTGDGYPTQGGYSPSWATSPDGVTWTWWGPITLFGRNQSSAAALIVDESRTDAYRFMAWIDLAGGLYLMHSASGAPNDWSSDFLNMWPIAKEQPQFVTAAKDQNGYHLIGADAFPATALRHVVSCDGRTGWHVVEMDSPVGNDYKGTNLVYDAVDNVIHALTSGVHFDVSGIVSAGSYSGTCH